MKRRPITGRFDVAVIPCGGAKHPPSPYGPYRAEHLYKGTPFRKNLQHARMHADRVLILSAKHGLLDLEERVEWYETYLPDLDKQRWSDLVASVRCQLLLDKEGLTGLQWVSYLPKAYQGLLDSAWPTLNCSRPYAGLNMLQMVKRLNQEIQDAKRPTGR